MELLEFYAGAYWRISGMIRQIVCHLEAASQGATLSDNVYDAVGATLIDVKREMERLKLSKPLNQLNRIFEYMNGKEGQISHASLRQRIAHLHERIIEDLEEGGLDCYSYLWTVTAMLPFVRMSSTVTSPMLFRTTKSISASPTGRFSTRITSSESGKKGELSWTAFSLNRMSIPRLASSIRFTAPAAQD